MVRGKVYQSTDALVRLVALLVRHIGETSSPTPKVNLLNKFLGIVAGLLIQDHEMQKGDFQQLPFHRLFIMLFYDLNVSDPIYETIAMQVSMSLVAIKHVFHYSVFLSMMNTLISLLHSEPAKNALVEKGILRQTYKVINNKPQVCALGCVANLKITFPDSHWIQQHTPHPLPKQGPGLCLCLA
jgi:hypothetical protein